ncbi:MAG: hypothetical protein KDA80_05205 [Planctomycetaceae bacterium]|nr:hypothetical protein [Planctomycetaceae bacterium]
MFRSLDDCLAESTPPLSLLGNLEANRLATMNDTLRAAGFAAPGQAMEGWTRLERLIQIDPCGLSVEEIYEEALLWAERQRAKERIRQAVQVERGRSQRTEPPVWENAGFGLVGNRDWENWGLGLDVDQRRHLYHFRRDAGRWVRHEHCTLLIQAGIQDGLAKLVVTGRGGVSEPMDLLGGQ